MNTFAFTFATIPDINAGSRLYRLDGLDDRNIAEVMFHRQRQLKGNEQLPLHQQQIVALSGVLRTADSLKIINLDVRDNSEQALLQQFFALMEKHAPLLVCWNGAAFERPVMHHRSILHGIGSTHYWHTNTHHVDLTAQIDGSHSGCAAPLDEIATLLGLPAKTAPGNSWDRYLAGELESIRNDCTSDAINTYQIHLRLQLVSGRLYQERYRSECQKLRESMQQHGGELMIDYLNRWTGGAA